MSDVRYCLFSILTATFNTWTQSDPSQPDDAPHRDGRDALSTANDALLLLLLLLLLVVIIIIIIIIIIISMEVTVSLKIFIPQPDPKSIINALLTFNLLQRPSLHSV